MAVFQSSDPTAPALDATQTGIDGTAIIGTANGVGVLGRSNGTKGFSGVRGESNGGPGVSGASVGSVGVDAHTQTGPAALRAINAGNGPGVFGTSSHVGVLGTSTGSEGFSGIRGESTGGPGVSGSSVGSVGVDAHTLSGPAALRAVSDGNGSGVLGISPRVGVFGTSTGSEGFSGVHGESTGGPGVSGTSVGSVGVDASTATGPAALRAVHQGNGLAGLFQGNVHVSGNLLVDGDVQLSGADLAEQFQVVGAIAAEAGSVVVLVGDDQVRVCDGEYDRCVAGVVSGAGDYRPSIVLDRRAVAGRLPLALTGKVRCKVDADHGPISVGDMLTTSATPGHAMRAIDPVRAFGSVLGKALSDLPAGRGIIPVLVALH